MCFLLAPATPQELVQPHSLCPPRCSPGRPGSGTVQPGGPPPTCCSWSGLRLLACSQGQQRGTVAEQGHKTLPHWLSGRSCPRTRQNQENGQVRTWEERGVALTGAPWGIECSSTIIALRAFPGPCQEDPLKSNPGP